LQKYHVLKAVAIVVIATGCGRILGFVRELIIAARYGTGIENDALIVALSLPDIILGIIAAALSNYHIEDFVWFNWLVWVLGRGKYNKFAAF
jgi:putative peptidoglycan lipid II flippase